MPNDAHIIAGMHPLTDVTPDRIQSVESQGVDKYTHCEKSLERVKRELIAA